MSLDDGIRKKILTQRKNHTLQSSDEEVTDQTNPFDGLFLVFGVGRFPKAESETNRETQQRKRQDGEERVVLHGAASRLQFFFGVNIGNMHGGFGVVLEFFGHLVVGFFFFASIVGANASGRHLVAGLRLEEEEWLMKRKKRRRIVSASDPYLLLQSPRPPEETSLEVFASHGLQNPQGALALASQSLAGGIWLDTRPDSTTVRKEPQNFPFCGRNRRRKT